MYIFINLFKTNKRIGREILGPNEPVSYTIGLIRQFNMISEQTNMLARVEAQYNQKYFFSIRLMVQQQTEKNELFEG